MYDAGEDTLNSMAQGGEMVGLLGETTLLRYFRDVFGQRPDVSWTAADAEAPLCRSRPALAVGRLVYLTRDLPGAAQKYSLDAAGPLIAVSPKAAPGPAPTGGQDMGEGIRLLEGAMTVRGATHTGAIARTTLVWCATRPITEELKVSARLMRDPNGPPLAANDQVPVHFTYPTTAWIPGERVQDVYDLPIPPAAPAADLHVLIILYRASDGTEIGRTELKLP